MAQTESNMMPLGTIAPKFELPDTVSDSELSFDNLKGDQGTVVMFICNHCPYVILVQEEIVKITEAYKSQGISFIAISSNDVENYPQDSPERMKSHAKENNFNFPYLFDESQEVAKAYQAACTPDFYLFDSVDKCVYRGRLDNATPGNGQKVTGKDLRDAIDDLIAGKKISTDQVPSLGCNIKWKQ